MIPAILFLFPAAAAPPVNPARAAEVKLQRIETGRVPRGGSLFFSTAELNAYAIGKIPAYAPRGVRAAKLEMRAGGATATGMIDFLKLRHATGVETNWIVSQMIQGERPVRVSVRIQSANGWATVFADRVEISGVAVSGVPLDLLIDAFFHPLFPDAKINAPFRLSYGVERISASPSGITCFMKR